MTDSRKQILVAGADAGALDDLTERFENSGRKVVVCLNTESLLQQLDSKCPEAIVIGEGSSGGLGAEMCGAVRKNVLLDRIPIFSLFEGSRRVANLSEKMGDVIDGALPAGAEMLASYGELLNRFRTPRFDPLTGLATGALAGGMLKYLCDDSPFQWTFLLVKVFGMRIYNIHTTYEDGDRMLGAVGKLLEETLTEFGHATDFAARLHGCYFCVATRTRRVETLVTKIMNQSARVFRKFYTPFEIVKGYITVEDEKAGGNYHIAELMIAGLQAPHHWQGHPAMLRDISSELIREVEREEAGYKIVALK